MINGGCAMPPSLQANTIPQCLRCLRSYASSRSIDPKHSLGVVVCMRGKKTSTVKGPEETVRLLKNMKGIGRRGDFVPVMAGKMRNLWVPNRIAEYATDAELRAFRLGQTSAESDKDAYVGEPGARSMLRSKQSAAPKLKVESLTPAETRDMIQRLVPTELQFFRKAISSKPTLSKPVEPADPKRPKGAGSEMLAARAQVMKDQEEVATSSSESPAIYGSVTTSDVYQAISVVLAADVKGKQIALSPNDIAFVEDPNRGLERGSKVRHIGAFTFEVKVPGDEVVVRRVARVTDQDVHSEPSKDILQYL